LFGLIAIGVVLDFINSLSHILWPFLGALPLIVILAVMIQEPLHALRALTPKDTGINVATPEEVYRARMAEAKLVFLSEVDKNSPPPTVRKRTK
jgi:hypothetical protein